MTGSNGRLTLPTPVKTDYTFMGWYLTGDTVAFSPDFVLSQDTTFFARWKTATMAQEYKADEIAIYASDRLIHIIGTSSDAAIYAAKWPGHLPRKETGDSGQTRHLSGGGGGQTGYNHCLPVEIVQTGPFLALQHFF